MTAPSSPSRYPPEFETALTRAVSDGTLFIPSAHPKSLRAKFWNYCRALRNANREDLADSVSFHVELSGLRIRRRSLTQEGLEVSRALNLLPPEDSPTPVESSPEDSLLERLSK